MQRRLVGGPNRLLSLFWVSMAGAFMTAFVTLFVVHYLSPSSRGANGSGPLGDPVAIQLVLVGGGCAGLLTSFAAALLLRRVELLPTTIVVSLAALAAVGGTAPFLGWLSAPVGFLGALVAMVVCRQLSRG